MVRLLRDARTRLIETGTRNRLIHTPRGAKRSKSLALTAHDPLAIFETAARSQRAIRFLPAPDKEGHPPPVVDERNAGTRLLTNLDEEALQKRLQALHRDAKTAEEEQGINILFLAYGFLRWFEDGKSEVARDAPLILIPVQLVRDKTRSGFDLRAREEDIVTNQALQQRLRADFGLTLPEVPDGDEWSATAYFGAVRDMIGKRTNWRVDDQGLELGFYSFAKLLMVRDLEPAAWPAGSILDHDLVRGLLVEGFRAEEPAYADDVRLDEAFAPADLVQVMDADSSQTLVIETARKGSSLVVQGPPGTGKSQTIANIIAAAVHDGRTVLFVAEKMVALEVVQDRLERAGIGQVCLQLHSRAANKRLVAEELGRTLARGVEAASAHDEIARLKVARDRLNATSTELHGVIPGKGVTPFQALGGLVAASGRPPVAQRLVDEAGTWNEQTYGQARAAVDRLSDLIGSAGLPADHPWRGVGAVTLQPTEVDRIAQRLSALEVASGRLAKTLTTLGDDIGRSDLSSIGAASRLLPVLEGVEKLTEAGVMFAAVLPQADRASIRRAVAAGRRFREARTAFQAVFVKDAAEIATQPLRAAILPGTRSFFARWGGAYRRASRDLAAALHGPLPPKAPDRLALVVQLAAFREARDEFGDISRRMEAHLAGRWSGEDTDFEALAAALDFVDLLRDSHPGVEFATVLAMRARGNLAHRAAALAAEVADLHGPLLELVRTLAVDCQIAFGAPDVEMADIAAIVAKASTWREARGRYEEWVRLAQAQVRLAEVAPAFAAALACGDVGAAEAAMTLRTAWSEGAWARALALTPALRDNDGAERDRTVSEFRLLDRRRREGSAAEIRIRHLGGMPTGSMGHMAVIRGEVGRKSRHMAIRRLVRETGPTLQRIKPVFLMSPISVAQYLAPGAVSFDLLVVDEASQIRPEDALGLIARARQIVVVGDKKQLPPTSFFDRLTADEGEEEDDEAGSAPPGKDPARGAKATEMESVLSLCEARGLPGRMLRWHYRSRHPSLIEVSNAEFYQRLVIPPAPDTARGRSGLVLHRVAGAYDRGGKRTNAIEAEEIARAAARHARTDPGLTLGIVTFSTAQRDAVTEAIHALRSTDDMLDAYLQAAETSGTEVFVKSLENVQGDERDAIFVSVGYGPRISGTKLDSMAFGPVSGEGGERRLNVLFTRARIRCQIFISFAWGDMDLARTRGEGPRVLKRFLQYAETGVLEERVSVGEDFDSPFEADVAAAIEAMGYVVEKQVGSAGFKIDLAVRHPSEVGRFMLAVECDGATYHSALWARERDRLRQEILEGLGWRFHRIWSTDWFYRRGAQLERLRKALSESLETDPTPIVAPPRIEPMPESRPAAERVVEARRALPPYRVAVVATPDRHEPHEVPVSLCAKVVLEIVRQEGPISREETARRYANLFNKERTGPRIAHAVDRAFDHLSRGPDVVVEGRFWMTPEQRDATPVRDRSGAPTSVQKAENIAPREIRAAIALAEVENGPMDPHAVTMAVARMFGFQRTGPDVRAAIMREVQRPA